MTGTEPGVTTRPVGAPDPWVWPYGQGPDHRAWDAYVAGAPPSQWAPSSWGDQGWAPPVGRPAGRRRPALVALTITLVVLVLASAVTLFVVTRTTGEGQFYRNDDYSVPEPDRDPPSIPRPTSNAAAQRLTEDNPLYEQRMPVPIRCEVGEIPTDVTTEDLDARASELTACLMRAWDLPVTGAGYELYRPTVTVFTGTEDSACGEVKSNNAAYCSGDQQVYMGTDVVETLGGGIVVDMIVAHEFGHLIQARTGILASARAIQQGLDRDEQLQLNRRIELQADCFAGLWINAVSWSLQWQDPEHEQLVDGIRRAGDRPGREGDHGQAESRARWLTTGIETDDISQCNTFTADPDQVV